MTRTWANDSGLALSASNLNAIEADIATALGVPDAALAARVVTGATATALNATFVPKWKATTAYLAGDKVLNPSGDVVSAIANFTSGASYNASNWNLSPSYPVKADVVPKWKASTAYTAGQQVVSPSGEIASAKVAFTSGTIYNAANWNLSPNYAQAGMRPAKAQIVFTFDDAPYTDKSIIMPMLTAKGIKGTFCVLTSVVSLFPTSDTQLTYVDLKAWEDAGHEISSHSRTHVNLTTVADDPTTLEYEIGSSRDLLVEKGLNPTGWCWPHSVSTAAGRAVVRKYYKYGLGGAGSTTQPVGTYQILRWGFGNTRTLVETQARIDTAVANKEMLVILVHSGSDLDAAHQTILGQVMDYAKASAASVVTAREAFESVGNLYEAGDYPGGNYTVIGGQGKLLAFPGPPATGPGDINSKIRANWFYGPLGGALANAAPPLNTLHAHAHIVTDPLGHTIPQFNITVATAGSSDSRLRVGIYADDNGIPGALIEDLTAAGLIDTSTTGSKAVTGLNRKLDAGRYWVAAVTQGTTAATLSCATGLSAFVAAVGAGGHTMAYTQVGITGALPANFGTPVSTNFAVYVALRAL